MFYLVYTLVSLISVYELILFARAICSWVPYFQESKLYDFAFMVTEPVLRPIRDFLFRFDVFRRLPIDFSMLLLFIALGVISRLAMVLFI